MAIALSRLGEQKRSEPTISSQTGGHLSRDANDGHSTTPASAGAGQAGQRAPNGIAERAQHRGSANAIWWRRRSLRRGPTHGRSDRIRQVASFACRTAAP